MSRSGVDWFRSGPQATIEIWNRLPRPVGTNAAADAILGLSARVVDELVSVTLATSDEAEALLTAMPSTLRNLKASVQTHTERCVGELRGPIQWSETLAAQASSFGNRDLFICAESRRSYDIDENRVLVAALHAIASAGPRIGDEDVSHGLRQRAVDNARQAQRFLDHPLFGSVRLDGRLRQRAIRRTGTGPSSLNYRPALAMLARAVEPLSPADIVGLCDDRSRIQHALFLTIIDELETRGIHTPPPRIEGGSLWAGPIEYINERRSDRPSLHGIVIGKVLVDVPSAAAVSAQDVQVRELQARAHGHLALCVSAPGDVVDVVDRLIDASRHGSSGKTRVL